MRSDSCFECGSPATHDPHIVPVSRGGTKTVLLCESCHAKAHHTDGWMGKSALVKSVLREKIRRGERTGTIPYGFRLAKDGIHVEDNPTKRSNIALVRSLYARGLNLNEISRKLESAGRANRKGRTFSGESLRAILKDRRKVLPRAKLSDARVDEIRRLVLVEGQSYRVVAERYGLTKDYVGRLVRGKYRSQGYKAPTPKWTKTPLSAIRDMLRMKRAGVTQRAIASTFNLSEGTVSVLIHKHLKSELPPAEG